MAIREELTGNYIMGSKDTPELTPEMFEELEKFKAEQQDFENKARIAEEQKRQELWANKSIMPFGHNIMIQPYPENPYLKKVNESGIILDKRDFTNQDTGQKDELDLGVPCARVVEVGPDVKYIRRGDEIIYMAQRVLPVPFMNTGFLLLNEGAVMCVINNDDNLKSRFNHLNEDEYGN